MKRIEYEGEIPFDPVTPENRIAGIGPAETSQQPTSYQQYLRSPEWRARRDAALKRAGHRCEDCAARRRYAGGIGTGLIVAPATQVHHLAYERVGREAPDDLIALCEGCHRLRHDLETEADRRRREQAWR